MAEEWVEARVIACYLAGHEFTVKLSSTTRSGESRLADLLTRAFEEKTVVRMAVANDQPLLLEPE